MAPLQREEVGPFRGLTWSGKAVPINKLLHDDGKNLWAQGLNGKRTLIWKHPSANVVDLAASPGGHEVALTVALMPKGPEDPSFVLYLLAADGRVEEVDVVRDYTSIGSPVFLTAPTELKGEHRLYWVRVKERVDKTGRLDTEVRVLDTTGSKVVEVPLRFAEAVFSIGAYPGAATFSITLFRQNDVPTRLEIVNNDDFSQSTEASLTLWGNNEFRANTDIFNGVAWLSPYEYVIPVASEAHPNRYSLRLYRHNCERFGSHVVYEGQRIDRGYSEAPWPLLPTHRRSVLVLGAREMSKVRSGAQATAPWLEVSVPNGVVRKTQLVWDPGAWAWVAADVESDPRAPQDCSSLRWTWP